MTTKRLGLLNHHSRFVLPFLYLRQTSAGLIIYQPLFIPFLMSRGISLVEVAFLQAIYNFSVLLFDIPCGVFADRIGAKWALFSANLCLVIGTLTLFFGINFQHFAIAEIFYGIAIAMDSGTHSSYLYEHLNLQNKSNDYFKYDAFGVFMSLCLCAIGTSMVGFIAKENIATPVLITAILNSIGVVLAPFLPPIKISNHSGSHKTKTTTLDEIKITLISILKSQGLKWALLLTTIWFWSRQFVALFITQPYLKAVGIPFEYYGILYAILIFFSGMIALASRVMVHRTDIKTVGLLGAFCIPSSFGLMAFSESLQVPKYGLVGFFLFAIPYGLCSSITNTILNGQYKGQNHRATFLSIVDFSVRILSSLMAIMLGVILSRDGAFATLAAAMAFSGVMLLILIPGFFKFSEINHTESN